MDLLTGAAIVTAGGILKAPVVEFLKRVSGPAGDEIGLWFRDKIREYRSRNAARVAERAQSMIAAAGADIHEIPPRTLIPILEGASIEDNAELAELWAALLANAATSEEDVIPPILPSILQQLTPFDAHIFARVHALQVELQTRERDVGPEGELPRWGVRRSEIGLVDADSERLESAINTLTALGLIEREPVMRFDNGQIFASDSDELRLSALGRRFLNACTPPSSGDVRAS